MKKVLFIMAISCIAFGCKKEDEVKPAEPVSVAPAQTPEPVATKFGYIEYSIAFQNFNSTTTDCFSIIATVSGNGYEKKDTITDNGATYFYYFTFEDLPVGELTYNAKAVNICTSQIVAEESGKIDLAEGSNQMTIIIQE